MKNMKNKMNMKNKILVPLGQGGYTADGSTPQAAVAVVIRKQSKKLHDLAARRRCELV